MTVGSNIRLFNMYISLYINMEWMIRKAILPSMQNQHQVFNVLFGQVYGICVWIFHGLFATKHTSFFQWILNAAARGSAEMLVWQLVHQLLQAVLGLARGCWMLVDVGMVGWVEVLGEDWGIWITKPAKINQPEGISMKVTVEVKSNSRNFGLWLISFPWLPNHGQ